MGHIGVNMDSVGDMWPIGGNRDEIKEAFGILCPQADAIFFVQEVNREFVASPLRVINPKALLCWDPALFPLNM